MNAIASKTTILFLSQGRAFPQAAMGHVRVRHALDVGAQPDEVRVELEHLEVPPLEGGWRHLLRRIPVLGRANLWSLRFVLARGWLARRLLAERLREKRLDAVHITTDQVAFLLGDVQSKVPCVLSLDSLYVDWNRMTHGIPPNQPTPWYLRPIGFLEKRALERAPLSIAWTDTVARSVRRAAPRARVVALHPGLDLEAFRPGRRVDMHRGGPRRLQVLFVGGRWRDKGGPELVAALRPRLGETVELHVVTTATLTAMEGVTVHRASPGSGQTARLFAEADVFCLPTKVDACPFVVLEAMASGVPVVSTRVGSIPEMVADAGLVVEPGDVTGLTSALQSLIEDRALRISMGEVGRARAEALYDARKNAPALLEHLRSVAAGSVTV